MVSSWLMAVITPPKPDVPPSTLVPITSATDSGDDFTIGVLQLIPFQLICASMQTHTHMPIRSVCGSALLTPFNSVNHTHTPVDSSIHLHKCARLVSSCSLFIRMPACPKTHPTCTPPSLVMELPLPVESFCSYTYRPFLSPVQGTV